MTTLASPKNVLISDVEFRWARLDTPVANPFGGSDMYELQVVSKTEEAFAELTALGAPVKEVEGEFVLNLRRKAERADGSANEPVRVVDANKAPIEGPARRKIGNGSRGNVIVWCAPYEYMKRTGVTFSLTAVQVVDLVEYNGGSVDFDVVAQDDAQLELF